MSNSEPTPSAPTGDHGGLRALSEAERGALRDAVQHIPWGRWDDAVCRHLFAAVERILTSRLAAPPEPEPAEDGEVGVVLAREVWAIATSEVDILSDNAIVYIDEDDARAIGAHLAAVLVAARGTAR